MRERRVIFWGSDAIALPLLEELAGGGPYRLVGVVSQPDRPTGRGKRLQPNPVAAWALERGVALHRPEKPDAATRAWVAGEAADLGLVMAYGHFLGRALRESFPQGMVNFHASLLPALRGASPVETAVALGLAETGVCLMQVTAGMDAGAVAAREVVPIAPDADAAAVRREMAVAAALLWRRTAPGLASDSLEWIPQPEAGISHCRKLSKADGALDFSAPADVLAARIRGLFPWPGCVFPWNGQAIKVAGAASEAAAERLPPSGTVLPAGEGAFRVATGRGIVRIFHLQRPGSRLLPSTEFLRGCPIVPGTVLESQPMAPLLREPGGAEAVSTQ